MRMFRRPRPDVPLFWQVLLTHLLHADERLAAALWQVYMQAYPVTSQTVRFALDQLLAPSSTQHSFERRLPQIRELLSPQLLLELCARVAPEGQPRPREVQHLEEAILHYTNAEGAWR
jgi:hypothetical protein